MISSLDIHPQYQSGRLYRINLEFINSEKQKKNSPYGNFT